MDDQSTDYAPTVYMPTDYESHTITSSAEKGRGKRDSPRYKFRLIPFASGAVFFSASGPYLRQGHVLIRKRQGPLCTEQNGPFFVSLRTDQGMSDWDRAGPGGGGKADADKGTGPESKRLGTTSPRGL